MKNYKAFYLILFAASLFYALLYFSISIKGNIAKSEAVDCNDEDKAIELYTKAIHSNELSRESLSAAYYGRGINRFLKGDHDHAIADFNKGIELNPRNSDNYFGRGITWHEKGEYNRAISDFKKGIELNPGNADNYTGSALAWHSKGNYDLSIVYFTKGIDLRPDDADIYFGRGTAWREKGDYSRAIADFNKAIELGYKHDFIYKIRAETMEAKAKHDLAHRGL